MDSFSFYDSYATQGDICYNVTIRAGEQKPQRDASGGVSITRAVETIPCDRAIVHRKAAEPAPKSAQTVAEDSESAHAEPREMREKAAEADSLIVTLANGENSEQAQESARDKPPMSNFSNARIY